MLKKLILWALIGIISVTLYSCSSLDSKLNNEDTSLSKVIKLDQVEDRASITDVSIVDTTITFTLNNLAPDSAITAGSFQYIFRDKEKDKEITIPLNCEGMEIFSGSKFTFNFNTLRPLPDSGTMNIKSVTFQDSKYDINK